MRTRRRLHPRFSGLLTALALAAFSALGSDGEPQEDFLPGCAHYGKPVLVQRVRHPLLSESSGIVASRKHPGILYTHNDSGSPPILFALRTTGEIVATYQLHGASNIDWEDIAIGPSPSGIGHSLYIGDIGNNGRNRNVLTVYVLPEPDLPPKTEANRMPLIPVACAAIQLQFPGPVSDCEAMAVHPISGAIYLVTKTGLLDRPTVLRANPPFQQETPHLLTPVVQLQLRGDAAVTGMDVHPVGTRLLIRTYRRAYEYIAGKPEEFELRLQQPPRILSSIGPTGQSEAICYSTDGESIFFSAEGQPMPLYHTPCLDHLHRDLITETANAVPTAPQPSGN